VPSHRGHTIATELPAARGPAAHGLLLADGARAHGCSTSELQWAQHSQGAPGGNKHPPGVFLHAPAACTFNYSPSAAPALTCCAEVSCFLEQYRHHFIQFPLHAEPRARQLLYTSHNQAQHDLCSTPAQSSSVLWLALHWPIESAHAGASSTHTSWPSQTRRVCHQGRMDTSAWPTAYG
jgi:hypothetical protein